MLFAEIVHNCIQEGFTGQHQKLKKQKKKSKIIKDNGKKLRLDNSTRFVHLMHVSDSFDNNVSSI